MKISNLSDKELKNNGLKDSYWSQEKNEHRENFNREIENIRKY